MMVSYAPYESFTAEQLRELARDALSMAREIDDENNRLISDRKLLKALDGDV